MPCFLVKWTQVKGAHARFPYCRPKYSPTFFETESVHETALSASKFLATMARSAKTWRILSSPGNSTLTLDGLSFQSNGHRYQERTLGVELLGRNVAPVHFKTERVNETAVRLS